MGPNEYWADNPAGLPRTGPDKTELSSSNLFAKLARAGQVKAPEEGGESSGEESRCRSLSCWGENRQSSLFALLLADRKTPRDEILRS